MKIRTLGMWVLASIAAAIIINCIGRKRIAGKSQGNIKTVEKTIVINNTVKAAT